MADDEQRVYGGRYELHRRIARGGMADVYLARDSLLDRPVALKVLFPEFATDRSFVERFRREAQSAANLSHPNIVSVYDWGEEDGTYFIVMEYVEGRSLAQILRDEGPLLPDRAADVTTDIAAALGFAHRSGVVHRDVKPGNVLISPLGQVKVTDFGIARAVTTEENLTQTGTVMGTATYFSPEQARGDTVDPRSDVYSLGVVLYELLVGEPPFTGDNPVSVAYKHVQESPDRPTSRNAEIPASLEAVTMKALAKNPANRYASAEDMADDLRRFRDGQPVLAEAILPTEALTSAQAPVGGPATAATTAVPRAAGDGTRVFSDVPREPYEPPRRSPLFVAMLALLLLLLLGALALLAVRLSDDDSTTQVNVPNVLGKTEPVARAELELVGLEVVTRQETVDGQPENVVIRQDPGGGARVDDGSTVTITINSGQPPAEVPELVGLSEAQADSALRSAGLTGQFERVESDRPAGEVLEQDPAPGRELPRGSVVKVTVSEGAAEEVVPDVTRLSEDAATARLERSGFQVEVVEESSASVPEGLVIRSDPAAGTEAARGSVVTIYVSTGEESTTTSSTTTTTTLVPTTSSSSSTTTTTTTFP